MATQQNKSLNLNDTMGWEGFEANFQPKHIAGHTWELAGYQVVRISSRPGVRQPEKYLWLIVRTGVRASSLPDAYQSIKVYYYSLALMVERLERETKKTKTLSR